MLIGGWKGLSGIDMVGWRAMSRKIQLGGHAFVKSRVRVKKVTRMPRRIEGRKAGHTLTQKDVKYIQ